MADGDADDDDIIKERLNTFFQIQVQTLHSTNQLASAVGRFLDEPATVEVLELLATSIVEDNFEVETHGLRELLASVEANLDNIFYLMHMALMVINRDKQIAQEWLDDTEPEEYEEISDFQPHQIVKGTDSVQ